MQRAVAAALRLVARRLPRHLRRASALTDAQTQPPAMPASRGTAGQVPSPGRPGRAAIRPHRPGPRVVAPPATTNAGFAQNRGLPRPPKLPTFARWPPGAKGALTYYTSQRGLSAHRPPRMLQGGTSAVQTSSGGLESRLHCPGAPLHPQFVRGDPKRLSPPHTGTYENQLSGQR